MELHDIKVLECNSLVYRYNIREYEQYMIYTICIVDDNEYIRTLIIFI